MDHDGQTVSSEIDLYCGKIQNTITKCNDSLKILTPRAAVIPKVVEAHIDTLCYCGRAGQPQLELAAKFRQELKNTLPIALPNIEIDSDIVNNNCAFVPPPPPPLPPPLFETKNEIKLSEAIVYQNATLKKEAKTLNIDNLRGPCGETNCDTAQGMRCYLEDLVDEDNVLVDLNALVGPCGSNSCNFIKQLKDFIFQRGVFAKDPTAAGKDHCSCTEKLKQALRRSDSIDSICNQKCDNLDNIFGYGEEVDHKEKEKRIGAVKNVTESQKVQNTYYCTVKLDEKPSTPSSKQSSQTKCPTTDTSAERKPSGSKFKHCKPDCPTRDQGKCCSKSVCNVSGNKSPVKETRSLKCVNSNCSVKKEQKPPTPSPADSDVEILLEDIRNPCCVKSCDAADRVINLIIEGLRAQEKIKCTKGDDVCFCDCSECREKISQ